MNVSAYISSLVQYGLDCGLIEPCDGNFIINQLLQALCLDSFEPSAPVSLSLEEILKGLVDDAVSRGICGEDITSRDLLDTKLMGILTPPPERYGRNSRKLIGNLPRQRRIGTTISLRIRTISAATASKRICVGKPIRSMGSWTLLSISASRKRTQRPLPLPRAHLSPAIPSVCCVWKMRATLGG